MRPLTRRDRTARDADIRHYAMTDEVEGDSLSLAIE